MIVELLIVSWKCQKMFSVDLAGASFSQYEPKEETIVLKTGNCLQFFPFYLQYTRRNE